MIRLRWLFLVPVLLGGCSLTDPYERPGNWRPMGANASNLAAMVANPADLVEGVQPTSGSSGQLAAAAVDRLRRDKVKALADSGVASVMPVPTTGGGAATPAPSN